MLEVIVVIVEVKTKWPRIGIIAVGATWAFAPDMDFIKMAKLLGASFVFEKPLNLYELLRVVNHLHKLKKIKWYDSNTCLSG